MSHVDHLSAEEIAGYLDQSLSGSSRSSIDEHLETCAQCRADLSASADIADSWVSEKSPRKTPQKHRSYRVGALAIPTLVAAAAAIVFLSDGHWISPRGEPVVRDASTVEGRSAIFAIAKAGEVIASRSPTFRWHRSSVSLFRFTLLTQTGEPVFVVETQDTALILPDSITLPPGRNYFWRVDGIGNGIVSSTGAILVRTAK
jgi:hypothetical protein